MFLVFVYLYCMEKQTNNKTNKRLDRVWNNMKVSEHDGNFFDNLPLNKKGSYPPLLSHRYVNGSNYKMTEISEPL